MAWFLLYDKAKALSATSVLADGVTVYTPGLSSRKGGSSEFRHGDLLGSLRFLTDANQNVVGDRLFSAFGATVAWDGDPSTPFGWVGDGESQTDADTGLVLMGHRVYDSRLGRFLSQDPAGDGDNWYAYADNDPIDEADPGGLSANPNPDGMWSVNGGDQTDAGNIVGGIEGEGLSSRNTWNQVNNLWTVNWSPGVLAQPGAPYIWNGNQKDQVNWATPEWNQGFMMGSRPPGMPRGTWKRTLLGSLQAGLAVLTLGGGIAHPANVPHDIPQTLTNEAEPNDKKKKNKDNGAGSNFALRNHILRENLAGLGALLLNGLNNAADAWARGTHGSGGYGGFAPLGGAGLEVGP